MLHLAVGANRGGNNPDRGSDASAMQAIAAILEWGGDINAINAAGDTPLHGSVTAPSIAEFLLARGARVDIQNKKGRTPLDVALRSRDANEATVALLRRAGGSARASGGADLSPTTAISNSK